MREGIAHFQAVIKVLDVLGRLALDVTAIIVGATFDDVNPIRSRGKDPGIVPCGAWRKTRGYRWDNARSD
jgi:hypothetical protein